MRLFIVVTVLALFIYEGVNAQENVNLKGPNTFIGEWTIDLRPTPESEGYYQPFIVKSVDGSNFKGTFYGSELEKALLNNEWDKLYFSFTTRDNANEYYHSGYLLDGKLYGISYCPNRGFTAPWTGKKE